MRTSYLVLVCAALCPLSMVGCTLITGFDQYSNHDRMDGAVDAATVDTGSVVDTGPTADAGDAARIDSGLDAGTDASTLGDGGHDAGFDAALPDAGPCPLGCGSGQTCCGGLCVDANSVDHCGTSCTVCASGPSSTATCTAGHCGLACTSTSVADCNGVASDGCERNIQTATDCGSCNTPCASGTCLVTGGTASCAPNCTAPNMLCGTTCLDTESSVAHCGNCTRTCSAPAGAAPMCSGGACMVACVTGFLDCNGDLAPTSGDGCETPSTAAWYHDADGDGHGAPASVMHGCRPAGGYVAAGDDCNDADLNIHPGAPERCNGVDDDCDGTADQGFTFMGTPINGTCRCTAGAVSGTVRCNATGTAAICNAAEACNGVDDDCDGTADNGFACVAHSTQTCAITMGTCTAAGTQTCSSVSCTLGACVPPAEICDGIDQNCDGFVDEGALSVSARSQVWTAGEWDPFDVAWGGVASGGAMVLSFTDSGATTCYLQAFDAGGIRSGTPITVDATNVTTNTPAIGWDGDSWVVVWIRTDGNAWLRTVHTNGTMTPPVSIGAALYVHAVTGSSGVGIATVAPTSLAINGGIYAHGAWVRALGSVITIPSGAFQAYNDIAATPAGGFAVVGSNWTQGQVVLQSFTSTTVGTQHTILADTNAEYPIHLDIDRASGNAMVAWVEQSETPPHAYAQPFVLATGAAIGAQIQMPGPYALEPYPVASASETLIAPYARMRGSDGTLVPENYGTLFGNVGGVLATPSSAQRYLLFAGFNPDSANDSRAVGCP